MDIGVILRAPTLQKERKQQMRGTLLASLMRATMLRAEGIGKGMDGWMDGLGEGF